MPLPHLEPRTRRVTVVNDSLQSKPLTFTDLGPALADVLQLLPLRERLMVACASAELRDFVYDHSELYPNLVAVALSADGPHPSHFSSTLRWAAKRQRVRRLRVAIQEDAWRGRAATADDFAEAASAEIGACLRSLRGLVSLDVCAADDYCHRFGPAQVATLRQGGAALSTLRQLSISATAIHFPEEGAALSSLTALSLRSSTCEGGTSGVTLAPGCLPAGIKRLQLSGCAEAALPPALSALTGLQSLAIDWAGDSAAPVRPDLSLLEGGGGWSAHLTHLSLGHFAATGLPSALPATLQSLELKWNVQTTEWEWRKDADSDDHIHAFLSSFSSLAPLAELKHLNLNNAVGGWGLPPAVQALTQLESLGVAGTNPFSDWGGRARALAPQLRRLRRLRRLDVEIYEAAAGWKDIAALSSLEELRLGKSGDPEEYCQGAVRAVVGAGLVSLLPALPYLKEVHTEGMLLPATSGCGRWNRLLGFEAPELREQAVSAVDALHARGVALRRWYAFPFGHASQEADAEWTPWDEVGGAPPSS